jgi:hypothetical protein
VCEQRPEEQRAVAGPNIGGVCERRRDSSGIGQEIIFESPKVLPRKRAKTRGAGIQRYKSFLAVS